VVVHDGSAGRGAQEGFQVATAAAELGSLESEKCCHSRIRTRAYIRDDVVTPLPPFTGSPSGSLRVLELGMPEKPALQGGSGPGHPP